MRTLIVLCLLAACSGGTPTTAEDCAGISSAKEKDACLLAVVPALFKANPEAGIKLVEEQISDPLTRDMAWYEVTKEVDPSSNKYCDRMKDRTLADRCRTVVARPHLHRDLTGQDATPDGMRNAPDRSKLPEDKKPEPPPKP